VLHYEAMTTTRVGRAAYHHGDLPNALADAATDLARGGGPEAVVLREAARRVGVSAAAAYRHYGGHGELLQAVKRRALEALADAMQAGLDGGARLDDPADEAVRRFRSLGRAYVGFALDNPGLFHTAFCRSDPDRRTAPGDVTARIASSRPYQILSVSLDELVAVGLLDEARRPVAPIAFWAAVHGLATLLVDGPLAPLAPRDQETVIQRTLDILIDGIQTPSRP
jgi:AcrR family transcriptional regulator